MKPNPRTFTHVGPLDGDLYRREVTVWPSGAVRVRTLVTYHVGDEVKSQALSGQSRLHGASEVPRLIAALVRDGYQERGQ